jgi:hypothetical protein
VKTKAGGDKLSWPFTAVNGKMFGMKKILIIIFGFTLILQSLFIPTMIAATDALGNPNCKNDTEIYTAIGCVPVLGANGQSDFLSFVLKWAVGVGGGIAFLLIIYGGFMVMTSSGNPERLKAGQELLTSAISGLILLIFSVFILKFIGVDILGLGAFGFGK